MNAAHADAKISNMQHHLNHAVQGLVLSLAIACAYCAILGELLDTNLIRFETFEDGSIYNGPGPLRFVVRFCSYWIIMYQVVPISLYLCFELLKMLLGYLIGVDKAMIDVASQRGAFARTADLVEELGQIDFVFSDKTGTLTENEMVFARCCINAQDLGDFRCNTRVLGTAKAPGVIEVERIFASTDRQKFREQVRWFFFCLVVCHSAQVEMNEVGEPKFTGSSPDEVAFLEIAHAVGVTYVARRRQPGSSECEVHVEGPPGEKNIFTVLVEIPFDSDRKRMTVICDFQGEFFCVTKGADNVMSRLTAEGQFGKPVLDRLTEYSKQGLRTLAICWKQVEWVVLEQWQQRWVTAMNADNEERNTLMADAARVMECDLQLVGITAIEDKLQEGVSEAIVTIKDAGIRFWVLTGDKTETAVEIVRACNLFTADMTIAYMTYCDTMEVAKEKIKNAMKELTDNVGGGLVLDGTLAKFALESPETRADLYHLAVQSKACVCCRLTPQQKRKLVDLVREQNPSTISLAIGDGANDVSMIQGAHVGIGLRGKEGNQAVQASDIAISQFRFLVPLMLCHGRRAYRRVSTFLCYFLYKHAILAVIDMIWAHQFSFRAETAMPETIASLYPLGITAHTVLIIMAFDVDVPDSVAMERPSLYSEGLARAYFNVGVFVLWMLSAIWHGALAWLIPFSAVGSNHISGDEQQDCVAFSTPDGNDCWDPNYEDADFFLASVTAFTLLVIIVNLRLWLFSMNRLWWGTLCAFASSEAICVIALFVLSADPFSSLLQPSMLGIATKMFGNWRCLLCIFVAPFATLLDCAIYVAYHAVYPTPLDQARAANVAEAGRVKRAWSH